MNAEYPEIYNYGIYWQNYYQGCPDKRTDILSQTCRSDYNQYLSGNDPKARSVNPQGRWKRWGYATIRILMLAACLYYTISFLMDYFTYPTVMTIHKDNTGHAQFPTVTFCNVNRLRKSYVCEHASEDTYESLHWKFIEGLSRESRKWCNRPDNYTFLEWDLQQFACPEMKSAFMFDVLSKISFYSNLKPEVRLEASHNVTKFLQTCLFNSYSCSPQNFSVVFSPIFGNSCYRTRFNEFLNSYGLVSGLTLIFDLEVNEYLLTELTNAYGMYVFVSNDTEHVPKMCSSFLAVNPGRRTMIVLEQIIEERLEPPYADKCKDYKNSTRQDCSYECWNNITFKKCGCFEPIVHPNHPQNCDYRNKTQRCCLTSLRESYMLNMKQCLCPHSCKAVSYNIFHSSDEIEESVYNDRGIGVVHMYLKSSDITYYKSNSKYRVTDFFSNLGGQLGLWLGLSLTDVVGRIYNHVIENCWNKKKKGKPVHKSKRRFATGSRSAFANFPATSKYNFSTTPQSHFKRFELD